MGNDAVPAGTPDSRPPVLFQGNRNDPTNLGELLGMGVGAASMCWADLAGAGEFDSTRASKIVDEMMAWIKLYYEPRIAEPSRPDWVKSVEVDEEGQLLVDGKIFPWYVSTDPGILISEFRAGIMLVQLNLMMKDDGTINFRPRRRDHKINVEIVRDGETSTSAPQSLIPK